MSDIYQRRLKPCPHCRGIMRVTAAVCNECGYDFATRQVPPQRLAAIEPLEEPELPEIEVAETRLTFDLKTLFLAMTWISLLLAVVTTLPAIGVLLMAFTLPAWIRTSQAKRRWRRRGVELDGWEVSWLFLGSIGVVAVIAGAGLGTFILLSSAGMAAAFSFANSSAAGPAVLIVSLLLAGAMGVAICVPLARAMWPVAGLGRKRMSRHS